MSQHAKMSQHAVIVNNKIVKISRFLTDVFKEVEEIEGMPKYDAVSKQIKKNGEFTTYGKTTGKSGLVLPLIITFQRL